MSEAIGQQPTDNDAAALEVLAEAHFKGFTTKSNYARKHADVIAMLACCNLISTHIQAEQWSNFWKITPYGLEFLYDILNGDIYDE